MAFKFINNSSNSQVRRTYACDDCVIEWTVWQNREDPPPECPMCELKASRDAVGAPAILTTKSQAVDIAQANMEAMGLTDFNDNQRKGDIAYKPPADPTTSEVEAMIRQSAEMARELEVPQLSTTPQVPDGISPAQMGSSFWGTSIGAPTAPPPEVQQALVASAGMGAAVARNEGRDPIAMLHKTKPPMKLMVEASDTGMKGVKNLR